MREKNGLWSVSLRLEITEPWRPTEQPADVVGVDVGIGKSLLIVMGADGSVVQKVANPRALRTSLADLRRASRALSRKEEGSPRWHQAKQKRIPADQPGASPGQSGRGAERQ